MSETAPGTRVPNVFFVDTEVTNRVRAGAVASRRQFGSRGRKVDAPFRMSELGDVANVVDADGDASGCALKVLNSFQGEARKPIDADAALNFERGDMEEASGERFLKAAPANDDGKPLLADRHVKLGAWDPNNRDPEWRADARYPDRSGGRWRGDIDFVINHPTLNKVVPLDWKSTSSYAYKPLFAVGAKRENSVQVAACAYEMRAEHYSLGYVNKESGQVVILTYETPVEWVETVLKAACDSLRTHIRNGTSPPRPAGTRPVGWADPPGSRYSGNKQLPDDPFYDRAFPCYVYGAKKDRVTVCSFYEKCHGVAPPERPAKPTRAAKSTKARGDPTKPSKGDMTFQ